MSWRKSDQYPVDEKELSEILARHINKVDLKRYDDQDNHIQLVYFIDLNSPNTIF